MSEALEARERLLQTFKRLTDKGYVKAIDADSTKIPVSVVYERAVPLRGNVHITMGRTLSRSKIDKLFAL